ncbi:MULTISPECIES: enoyl-CoA hydratase/isomerase family protein [Pseudomonas]|nr:MULTISPECIES: enoyl-CoA hydratase/isomerase family protein [Pseudomonas]
MTQAQVEYTHEAQGRVAVLRMVAPPVNAFSLALRRELLCALQRAGADPLVAVVILTGAGRGFSAGGDIREFGTPDAAAEPGLSSHIHVTIEKLGKPVIALAHGFAMGGGLETLLACHYRIAETDTRLALPEVSLGTLALSATQRLPRLLGILPALRLMVEGTQQTARDHACGPLFHQVVAVDCGLDAARRLATQILADPPAADALAQRLVRNHPWREADPECALTDAELWLALRQPNVVAQAAFQAIEAAVLSPCFDDGLATARRLYDALMADERIIRSRERFLASPAAR